MFVRSQDWSVSEQWSVKWVGAGAAGDRRRRDNVAGNAAGAERALSSEAARPGFVTTGDVSVW